MHDDAAREALIVLWKASDRICGKRLRPMVPLLVESMERHGDRQLAPEFRTWLLANSAATIDRALKQASGLTGGSARHRSSPSALRRSIPIRASDGWDNPAPGDVEVDLVAHSGPTAGARSRKRRGRAAMEPSVRCRSPHRDAPPWPTSTGHSHRPPPRS